MNSRRAWTTAVLLGFVVGGIVLSAGESPEPNWFGVLLFGLLAILLDLLAFQLPGGGSISMAFVMPFTALLLYGVLGGVIAAAIGTISILDIRSGKPLTSQMLNSLQLTASMVAAGMTWMALGGEALMFAQSPTDPAVRVFAAIGAALCFFLVNSVSAALLFWTQNGESVQSVIRSQEIPRYAASLVTLSLLAVVLAELLFLRRYLSVLLMLIPFVVARVTFRAAVEVNRAYVDTVRGLVSALEQKDAYTTGHSLRVAEIAAAIGRRLGLRIEELNVLEVAALLHDIGKIGVSTRILNAKGQLDSAAWNQIRRHPETGASLVAEVEFLRAISRAIRHHHERFDGSGYPDGLRGQQIPLHSRILAVADSYDAMTSQRAYRNAIPSAAAVEEVERLSSTQFDPVVAKALRYALRDVRGEGSVRHVKDSGSA